MPLLARALVLVLCGLFVAVGHARAADRRPVELPLASGKVVEGVVESADVREVVVRVGPDEVRRLPWAQLSPLGAYRARAALAPPADGGKRLELAEMAVDLGLYAEARVEYEKALALGVLRKDKFAEAVASAEYRAVEAGIQRARKAADEGEWEQALRTARDLKVHFGGAPNAGQVDKLVAGLLKRISKLKADALEASKELERVKVEADRNKEILKRRTKATAGIADGRKQAELAAESRAKGNVTRARKYAEKSDQAFMESRRNLGRLRRIVPRTHPTYPDLIAQLSQLDREQFDLLFTTARFFWEQTVFSRADEYAARASFIDPVHPDLLELRELLRVSRIRYRFSDVTNARPIIR